MTILSSNLIINIANIIDKQVIYIYIYIYIYILFRNNNDYMIHNIKLTLGTTFCLF